MQITIDVPEEIFKVYETQMQKVGIKDTVAALKLYMEQLLIQYLIVLSDSGLNESLQQAMEDMPELKKLASITTEKMKEL